MIFNMSKSKLRMIELVDLRIPVGLGSEFEHTLAPLRYALYIASLLVFHGLDPVAPKPALAVPKPAPSFVSLAANTQVAIGSCRLKLL